MPATAATAGSTGTAMSCRAEVDTTPCGTVEVVGTGAGQVDPARVAEQPVGRPVLAERDPVLVQAELGDLQVCPAQ